MVSKNTIKKNESIHYKKTVAATIQMIFFSMRTNKANSLSVKKNKVNSLIYNISIIIFYYIVIVLTAFIHNLYNIKYRYHRGDTF